MFNVVTQLETTPSKCEVYAGAVRRQIEAGAPIIALEADLMSSMAMDGVHKDHPQHVINCGIMEANVIGVAAGLPLTGRVPFVHTFTAFASRRCFDQLFMSLDYQRNNVKVIASDAGVSACHNGGTYMSFEDMGIVRGLAHSVVLEVTDATMFADILRQLMDLRGFYCCAHHSQAGDAHLPGGLALYHRQGQPAARRRRHYADCQWHHGGGGAEGGADAGAAGRQRGGDRYVHPRFDRELIKTYAAKTGRIVTCENHSIHNGLGSAVAEEVLAEECPAPMRRVG